MTVNTLMVPRKEKLDHELIDGAPAARFTRRLKELIQAGYGLIEQEGALPEPLPVPDSSR